MKKKIESLVWIIFATVGAFFLLIGIIICINIFNYSNIDGDRNYDVFVSYDVNGEEYESRLNGYSSSFYEGKEVDIYYDKDNPNKIGIKSLNLVFLIFPGLGLIFFIIGGVGLFVKAKGKKNDKYLKENGEKIYADFVDIKINTGININGAYPYNIICEWNNPEDNKKYVFKSRNIWTNPKNIIEERNIKQFAVYIDRENIKKYFVDIEGLEENIVDLT